MENLNIYPVTNGATGDAPEKEAALQLTHDIDTKANATVALHNCKVHLISSGSTLPLLSVLEVTAISFGKTISFDAISAIEEPVRQVRPVEISLLRSGLVEPIESAGRRRSSKKSSRKAAKKKATARSVAQKKPRTKSRKER